MKPVPDWVDLFGSYLNGRVFAHKSWSAENGGWFDHDHCGVCQIKIWDRFEQTGDGVSTGWVSIDGTKPKEWICEECFAKYAIHLGFKEASHV